MSILQLKLNRVFNKKFVHNNEQNLYCLITKRKMSLLSTPRLHFEFQKELNDFSFLPFTVFLLLFWIFIYINLPETKNRTFEDIASSWNTSQNEAGNPEAKYTPTEDTGIIEFQQQRRR